MGWAYILIRTFPFWAIPFAIALITGYFSSNKRAHGRPSILWLLLGVILLGASVFFLIAQGHVTAVPFFHEAFTGKGR